MKVTHLFVRLLATVVVFIGLTFIYAALIEPYWIEVREQPVYIKHLPETFEGLRIVQLSDLHGKWFPNKKIGLMVNKLHPDLVVITGDMFDKSEENPARYLENVLGDLNVKFGTYFVFGNNEVYLDRQMVKEELAKIDIKTLINNRVRLINKGSYISLIGVDDAYTQECDPFKALEGTGTEPKILLAHTPEIIFDAVKARIDLALVGHTHGGQILIPFFPRFTTNVSISYEKYLSGLYQVGGTQMFVNRGLGENDIHLRFMSRPEITVIILHRNGTS